MNQSWIRYLPAFCRERLEGRHSLQNVISNTGWLFTDNILRMGIGFLVGIWVTRYLGPERFGLLSYAIAFVTLFSSIAQLGLDGIVVRNLVRTPARRDEILGSAFVLKLTGGLTAAGLALGAIIIIRPGDPLVWLLIGITSLGQVFQSFGVIDFWFQSQVQSKYCVWARIAAYLISSAAKVILILLHAPLAAFLWAGVFDTILGAVGMAIAYRMNGARIRDWRAAIPIAQELLYDSWPLILTDVVIMIYLRVDKIMLGDMVSIKELGIYSVAAMLAEALSLIPRSLSSSLFPAVLQAQEVSDEYFHERLQQFYNIMALFAYLVALPVTFLAGWGVPFLFGAPFAAAGPMLVGLVWAGLFINLGLARSYYLTAMNWTRLHFITDFMGCVVNIALNFYLIPRYGGMGAVISACVAYWLVAHGTCMIFKPLRRTGAMLTRAMLYPKVW
jgi:O-antigen/teichoic acid export membrane protein